MNRRMVQSLAGFEQRRREIRLIWRVRIVLRFEANASICVKSTTAWLAVEMIGRV